MDYHRHKDDRSAAEQSTHSILWGGRDACLSGWGHAEGRDSYAYWACRPEDSDAVEKWVRSRSDIENVRDSTGDHKYGSGGALVRIYVIREGHPALRP